MEKSHTRPSKFKVGDLVLRKRDGSVYRVTGVVIGNWSKPEPGDEVYIYSIVKIGDNVVHTGVHEDGLIRLQIELKLC